MTWHEQNPSNYCGPKAMLPGIRAPDSTAWKLFKPRKRNKIKGLLFLLPFYLPMFVADVGKHRRQIGVYNSKQEKQLMTNIRVTFSYFSYQEPSLYYYTLVIEECQTFNPSANQSKAKYFHMKSTSGAGLLHRTVLSLLSSLNLFFPRLL